MSRSEISRRALLAGAAALAARCAREPAPPPGTRVPLANLPLGERVVVDHQGEPVELLRTASGVRARSLWCTHTGCRVVWKPEQGYYQCLCHEAHFDDTGRVLSGPPPRPLREVRTLPLGEEILLLAEPAATPPPPAG